jgi:hypothetical protein
VKQDHNTPRTHTQSKDPHTETGPPVRPSTLLLPVSSIRCLQLPATRLSHSTKEEKSVFARGVRTGAQFRGLKPLGESEKKSSFRSHRFASRKPQSHRAADSRSTATEHTEHTCARKRRCALSSKAALAPLWGPLLWLPRGRSVGLVRTGPFLPRAASFALRWCLFRSCVVGGPILSSASFTAFL